MLKQTQKILDEEIRTTVETQLGLYPFCVAWNSNAVRRMRDQDRVQFDIHRYDSETDNTIKYKGTLRWDKRLGPPGTYVLEIWRAIEHHIHTLRAENKLTREIEISFKTLREYMPLTQVGGRSWQDLKRNIRILSSMQFSLEAFYVKRNHQVEIFEGFSLLESLTFVKVDGPTRTVGGIRFTIPEKLYWNYQDNYVRPLDKGFRDSLKNLIARRLYEILMYKFYTVKTRFSINSYQITYSRLCGMLGCKQQQYLSLAKKNLQPSIDELIDKKLITYANWSPRIKNKKKQRGDWNISFHIGPKAIEEIAAAIKLHKALPGREKPIDKERMSKLYDLDERDLNLAREYLESKVDDDSEVIKILKQIEDRSIHPDKLAEICSKGLEQRIQEIFKEDEELKVNEEELEVSHD